MLLAELPSIVTDAGIIAGVIVALGGALKLVGKSPPGKWLWQRNVTEPLGGWLDHRISKEVKAEVKPVLDSIVELRTQDRSLNDRLIAHMQDETDLREADLADRAQRQSELDEWRENTEERLDRMEGKLDQALAKPTNTTELTVDLHVPPEATGP